MAAERWFLRFTVLASRQVERGQRDPAGLDWLGPLPTQQREAIVLHHGLQLDLHRVAAAMDCSSSAASNHLVAATAQLRRTGPVDAWTAGLPARLAAVMPPPAVVSGLVTAAVARRRRWVWLRRLAIGVLIAAAAIAGWAGWQLWRMLVF